MRHNTGYEYIDVDQTKEVHLFKVHPRFRGCNSLSHAIVHAYFSDEINASRFLDEVIWKHFSRFREPDSHIVFFHHCREFSKEKEKIDRTLLFRKERQEKREQQDYLGYKEWIELAGLFKDTHFILSVCFRLLLLLLLRLLFLHFFAISSRYFHTVHTFIRLGVVMSQSNTRDVRSPYY